jgi:hypothetical protein
MPQNPGNDTVTFKFPGVIADRLHKVAGQSPSHFNQGGCSMQPASVKDKVDNTAYSEATDKCLAPYNTQTAQVQAEWYIQFGSGSFRVLGAKPFSDRWGRVHHITFICRDEAV